MVDLTPPSSSANTPKREMDIDEHDEHDLERRYSSGSDEGEPGASDTELDDTEPIETGQATPPLVEGEAGPSTATVSELAFAYFNPCLSTCWSGALLESERHTELHVQLRSS